MGMKSEWTAYTLGEITDLVIDHRGKTPKKLGGDWSSDCTHYRALSAKNIKTGQIVNPETIRYVSPDMYSTWMKEQVQKGDIFITSEAPFGQILYWDSDEKIVLSQRIFGIRLKKEVCSRYVYYYMLGTSFQAELDARATGTTVFGLRQPELLKCTVRLPSLPTQRKIAAILSSLDDKIENNNAICKNLEEQAAALYKSWFVDFEPFGGQKPSRWGEHVLGDYFPVITGKKNANISSPSGIYPFFSCSQEIAWTNEYSFEGNAILVAGNGDFNVKRYCGKFEAYQRTYVLIPEEPSLTGILYQAVKYGLAKITSAARGSVIKFITKGNIADHPVDLPDNHADYPVIDAINTIHKRIDVLNSENLRIATLRDTLLPKLMSGEIDVDKVAI